MSEPLFEREDWHLLRTVDGVCQMAGCSKSRLPFMVMKELFDNACDAAGAGEIRVSSGWLTVSDNGPGIPGTDEEIAALFSPGRPLRSSKLLRRPTRGAMGNGLRVVVGAVLATGGALTVETGGRVLVLKPQDDGSASIVRSEPSNRPGAAVSVLLPGFTWPDHGVLIALPFGNIYQGKSSPWWYTTDAFRELLQASPMTVRELMASMEGLSGANAGKVADAFKGRDARSLTVDETDALLVAARAIAREVKPERLGTAGQVDGYHYAKKSGYTTYQPSRGKTSANIPFVVEVWSRAAANRSSPKFTIMVNRSPVVAPPQTFRYKTGDNKDAQFFDGCGLRISIPCGRFTSDVAINVTTPYLRRTDNGKAPDLASLSGPIREALEQAFSRAKRANPLHAKTSQVSIILDELPAAAAKAGDNGANRFSLRQVFYNVRPALIEATGKTNPSYPHFGRTIAKYEDKHGKVVGMYRDSRGIIYHPHLRQEIPLGTLSVERYKRPEWTFGAVLYIEKEGYVAALRENGWPERNDCALMTGKGFASGAARDLIDLLGSEDRDLLFFCVHDADGPGTMIYQALQEATVARRKRRVRIIDLGLNPDEGRAMGLQVEPVNRRGRTPVARYVPAEDVAWLQKNRIELNAMSTGQFLKWLDQKIAPHLRGKVVPPASHLQESLIDAVRETLIAKLQEEAILQASVAERAEKAMISMVPALSKLTPHLAGYIQTDLESNPAASWRNVITGLSATIAAGGDAADVLSAPIVPDRSPPPPVVEDDSTDEDEDLDDEEEEEVAEDEDLDEDEEDTL